MKKKVLVLSTSPRQGGNSDLLADQFLKGVKEAGHEAEKISLKGKNIEFCRGCLACQKTLSGHCVTQDDADAIVQKMRDAEVLVFATPIYFYEMCGQMKTLLDRTNPLFAVEYQFREIYLLCTAADDDPHAMDGAVKGLQGWIDCYEQAKLADVLCGLSLEQAGAVRNRPDLLQKAYEMGLHV